MGNVISYRSAGFAQETTPMLVSEGVNKRASFVGAGQPPPLFLDEIEPAQATWSKESKCVMIQRLFGWLPDSTAETLKQDQKASLYLPRAVWVDQCTDILGRILIDAPRSVYDISKSTSRGQAIIVVQRVYRRYRLLCKWHLVSSLVLELAQNHLRQLANQEEEEEMLGNFRQILSSGFSAQKVSITGTLKNVELQLVLKPDQEECYLTWTPSRKRHPRINLCDIEEVIPVQKEGNKHVPRLANKVSHRRGLIIICKSHHRGRVVLQMNSKRERKILLLGFQRLLEDLNRFAPSFDETGSIRKRLPRRQSAIQFFEADPRQADRDDDSSKGFGERDDTSSDKEDGDKARPSKLNKRHSTPIEHFYQTRFDDSLVGSGSKRQAPTSEGVDAITPSLTRRLSVMN